MIPRARASMALAGALAFAALCARPSRAYAIGHEPYATVGGGYFGGISHVVVGLGGGAGYRLHLDNAFSLYMESRWLLYGGNAFTTSLGALYTFHVRGWAPAAGLQLTASWGQQLRVIDASMPDVPSLLAFSAQIRIAPLRFVRGQFTVAALIVDLGAGLEAGRPAIALSFSIAEIGVRF